MLRVILAGVSMFAASAAQAETFRLVHAVGNSERVVAKDLSREECEARKRQQKQVADALGVGGSVTCLPESLFND